MGWNAIQAVAEAIGAVAVVASLIYLAVQIRQNTRAVRAATYDAMVRGSGEFLRPMIDDAELARAFELVAEDWNHPEVSAEARTRAMYLLTQLFREWENAYYQWRQGTLEYWLWKAWETVILSYYHHPGIQQWWRLRRMAFSEPFQAFLEMSSVPTARIVTTEQAIRAQEPDGRMQAGKEPAGPQQ